MLRGGGQAPPGEAPATQCCSRSQAARRCLCGAWVIGTCCAPHAARRADKLPCQAQRDRQPRPSEIILSRMEKPSLPPVARPRLAPIVHAASVTLDVDAFDGSQRTREYYMRRYGAKRAVSEFIKFQRSLERWKPLLFSPRLVPVGGNQHRVGAGGAQPLTAPVSLRNR